MWLSCSGMDVCEHEFQSRMPKYTWKSNLRSAHKSIQAESAYIDIQSQIRQ